MKKLLVFTLLCIAFFYGNAQSQDKVGLIKKNQKGIITSVKFSDATAKSKIPASVNVFGGVRGGLSS